jgi:hypothetical protein
LPLYDALVGDERFRFILGLQEVPVMAMADGFTMASRSLGVVNLHISCGLGNAMGMLYNAWREGIAVRATLMLHGAPCLRSEAGNRPGAIPTTAERKFERTIS